MVNGFVLLVKLLTTVIKQTVKLVKDPEVNGIAQGAHIKTTAIKRIVKCAVKIKYHRSKY